VVTVEEGRDNRPCPRCRLRQLKLGRNFFHRGQQSPQFVRPVYPAEPVKPTLDGHPIQCLALTARTGAAFGQIFQQRAGT
jgi:hypothetical protein